MNRHDEPERLSKNVLGFTSRFNNSVEFKPSDEYKNNFYNLIKNYEMVDLITYRFYYCTTIYNNNHNDRFDYNYSMKITNMTII